MKFRALMMLEAEKQERVPALRGPDTLAHGGEFNSLLPFQKNPGAAIVTR